jgi:uncharacterized CHY-type Zn-finger protein
MWAMGASATSLRVCDSFYSSFLMFESLNSNELCQFQIYNNKRYTILFGVKRMISALKSFFKSVAFDLTRRN